MEYRNSLAYVRPDIAAQWDYEKNNGLSPSDVAAHSNKSVWWLCEKGHSFLQPIHKRTERTGNCPFCSGKRVLEGYNDLATLNPSLLEEWDYKQNSLLPTTVSAHSNKKVHWICKTCGNNWVASINDRSNGQGCPICARNKRAQSYRTTISNGRSIEQTHPELLLEWDYDLNLIKPSLLTAHSHQKAWWKCTICGHSWRSSVKSRTSQNSGCPKCHKYTRTSFSEQALFYYIKQRCPDAINSYTDEALGKMELDIYIPSLCIGIEYDGEYWHSSKHSVQRDKKKYQICKDNGIFLIRVTEKAELDSAYCDSAIIREDGSKNELDETIRKVIHALNCPEISVDTQRDRAEIMLQYITHIKGHSIAACFPQFVNEWDVAKNNGITADMVYAHTRDKYWWKCPSGHSYQSSVSNKTGGDQGCPICSNKLLLSGFNDLQTRYPSIASEWNESLNAPYTAQDIFPGSVKKYWWTCSKGHNYLATPNNRTSSQSGCPYCSGKIVLKGFNDLMSQAPETAKKWNYIRNGELKPDHVCYQSSKKVWWICSNGHEWQKTIASQVSYDSCPICRNTKHLSGYNDLSTTHPEIAREWNYDKNQSLLPSDVRFNDQRKVWWKCHQCGNEWLSRISVRTRTGCGCPKCGYALKIQSTRKKNTRASGKDLLTRFPDIAAEWDYEHNTDLDPSQVSYGSNHKVWWKCKNGHFYQAWITDRTGKRKTGCPYCAGKRKITDEAFHPKHDHH